MPDPEATNASIGRVIVDAIFAGRITAGTRLGEQSFATLFAVSRTIARETLIRLEARGIVQVSPRRGWFVIRPSLEEAQEAFQARRAIGTGLLMAVRRVGPDVVARLRAHVAQERQAIAAGGPEARSFLLGHFHVCLVEALGNRVLAAGDTRRAADPMVVHIGHVEAGLTGAEDDPLTNLRHALELAPRRE